MAHQRDLAQHQVRAHGLPWAVLRFCGSQRLRGDTAPWAYVCLRAALLRQEQAPMADQHNLAQHEVCAHACLL